MFKVVKEFPHEIMSRENGPCISVYQPTHRNLPENQQDAVQLNNTIRELEVELKKKYPDADMSKILEPLKELRDDRDFWNTTLDGIVILADKSDCIVYNLPRSLQNKYVVGDSFHIMPLIREFQSADKYHLLGINGSKFSIFEANRYGIEELKVDKDVPVTIEDVLGSEHTEKYLNHGSYSGSAGSAIFHGQGSKKDDVEEDLFKYFRYVDKVVHDQYSDVTKFPLILVSLKEHQGLFRKISKSPYLVDEGIKSSYEALDQGTLKDKAWEIMEQKYIDKTNKLIDEFNQAKAGNLGSDDFHKIKKAVVDKRVKTLMVEADRTVSSEVDAVARNVLAGKGQIIVLPKDRMPSDTGVAAIYRF